MMYGSDKTRSFFPGYTSETVRKVGTEQLQKLLAGYKKAEK